VIPLNKFKMKKIKKDQEDKLLLKEKDLEEQLLQIKKTSEVSNDYNIIS
jgi:hypothetical protein